MDKNEDPIKYIWKQFFRLGRLLIWHYYMIFIIRTRLYRVREFYWHLQSRFHKPLFAVGDLAQFDLSYATVIYEIAKVVTHRNKEKYYQLRGIKIVKHDGTNPYMTEAKSYDPFCIHFDKTAKRVDRWLKPILLGEKNGTLPNS